MHTGDNSSTIYELSRELELLRSGHINTEGDLISHKSLASRVLAKHLRGDKLDTSEKLVYKYMKYVYELMSEVGR